MKKRILAMMLSATIALGTVNPEFVSAATAEPFAVSVDFASEETNAFVVEEKIHNLKGTVENASNVASMRYEITDAHGILVKSGNVSVSKGKWKISKIGFVLGTNTLTFYVTSKDGNEYKTTYAVSNKEEKNAENTDIDTNDNDNDGLINYWEQYFACDMNNADTDGDGLSDYDELFVVGTLPQLADSDFDGISDADEDEDKDGLSNAEEIALGTNPCAADTDADGLTDAEEVALGTNPANADTDDDNASDGFEVAHGYDPLVKGGTFYYTLSAASVELSLKANGSAVDTISFEVSKSAVAGGLTNAASELVEVKAEKLWRTAELSCATDNANAVFYKYDLENQTLTAVATTVSGNVAKASITEAGLYILVNGKIATGDQNFDSDSLLDSNKDGITDEATRLMVEGKLLTGTGAKVFGDATFEEVQANADFDQDGLKNGKEIEIRTNEAGVSYVYLLSSPILADTDADGIKDDEDTAPFEYGLAGGVVGYIKLIARFQDMKLSYDENGELVLDENGNVVTDQDIFFTGHSWFCFTSYVDNYEFTLNEVNKSYRYFDDAYSVRHNQNGAYVETSLNSEDGATYVLNRGDSFTVGNYRTKKLDAIYDVVMKDAHDFVEDLELEDVFDKNAVTMDEIYAYLMSKEGYARVTDTINGSPASSIRYNEEMFDTYELCDDYTYEFDNGMLGQEVTLDALDEIMAFDNNHNYYNLFVNNCSSISSAAWNIVCKANGNEDMMVSSRGTGIYSIIDTPMSIKNQMKQMDGGVIYTLDKNNATADGKVVYATPEICKEALQYNLAK